MQLEYWQKFVAELEQILFGSKRQAKLAEHFNQYFIGI